MADQPPRTTTDAGIPVASDEFSLWEVVGIPYRRPIGHGVREASVKRLTKAAIATGGAAVLLLGGAGTFAYWTADGTASGKAGR